MIIDFLEKMKITLPSELGKVKQFHIKKSGIIRIEFDKPTPPRVVLALLAKLKLDWMKDKHSECYLYLQEDCPKSFYQIASRGMYIKFWGMGREMFETQSLTLPKESKVWLFPLEIFHYFRATYNGKDAQGFPIPKTDLILCPIKDIIFDGEYQKKIPYGVLKHLKHYRKLEGKTLADYLSSYMMVLESNN